MYAKDASGTAYTYEDDQCLFYDSHSFQDVNVIAIAQIPTPTPKVKPKPITVAPRRGSDCVTTLKQTGLLPQGQVTKDGLARTIPIKPVELQPGDIRVIRTNEGRSGHVLQVAVEEDGTVRSITEGGYAGGVGRIVPRSVIQGEVIVAIPR